MGAEVSRTDFHWIPNDEPHATRRRLILQKYPEVKKLMQVDKRFKWIVVSMVMIQIIILALLQHTNSFIVLALVAYFVFGVINHSLTLAIHEISHGQAFGQNAVLANRLFGMFANLPLGLPMYNGFKVYHAEHHRYLGVDMLDPDLPSDVEAKLFRTPLTKVLFLVLQPLFYTLRPLFRRPKPITVSDMMNVAIQAIFDCIIGFTFGWWAIAYMIVSSIIATGLHPMTGHFLAEHYILHKDRDVVENLKRSNAMNDPSTERSLIPETYSYYGPFNWITFNVGYHVEHHDFPSIPAKNLPILKKTAPEFYDNLYYHTSWVKCLYSYVVDPNFGPLSRAKIPYEQALDRLKYFEPHLSN